MSAAGWERQRAATCSACGHSGAAHNYYSRCLGTLSQPDCRCLLTPSDICEVES